MTTVIREPRHLIAALGGAPCLAKTLRTTPAAVRQWAVRGYVPYRSLLALRRPMAQQHLRYAGRVTPGFEDAPR